MGRISIIIIKMPHELQKEIQELKRQVKELVDWKKQKERQQHAQSIGDSNGAKTPTGSYSMEWAAVPSSQPIGGVMGHVYVSSGASANTGFFSFM